MVLAHNIREGNRTQDIEISVDVNFDSMLLTDNVLKGLRSSGFYKPSPIQLHGIPLGKCGFDLFLEAKSGTGKTAVFTVIALEKIDLHKGLQSIILAPTREIAAQISDVIKQIGSCYKDLNVEVVMGGLPIEEDIQKFREKVHILVGSPGRMRHLIHDNHIDVSAVRLFVLDEADKLMHKNFQADINYIFSVLPKQKQVIMSSATYPDALKSIMQNYVQKAQHICPDSNSILLGINQLVTTVKGNINIVRQTQNKFGELLKILSSREFKQCLIFCNYQVRVGELCKMLTREKWPAEKLHGQLDQTDRLDALKTLQEYKCRILVSTDLAARGIDASNVDLVINFEPPYEWQTYLHRIGRAGRFGSYGIAITILSEGKEMLQFKKIMESIKYLPDLKYLWSDTKFELDKSVTNNSLDRKPTQILEASQVVIKEKELLKIDEVHSGTSTIEKKSETLEIKQIDEIEKVEEKVVMKKECNEVDEICKLLEIPVVEENTRHFHEATVQQNKADSFANLLNSFEKSNIIKMECFEDLIASFKNHKPNNDEGNENQHGNFNMSFDSMLNMDNAPNIILESTKDTGLEVEMYTIDECEDKQFLQKSYKEKIPTDSLNMISSTMNQFNIDEEDDFPVSNAACHNALIEASQEKIPTDSLNMISSTMNQLNIDDEDDFHVSNPACHNALIEAGLPTSFGSKKNCNKKHMHKTKSQKNDEYKTKQKSNDNKSNNKNNSTLTRSKLLTDSTLKSSSGMSPTSLFDDGYNTHSCLYSRSTKYLHPNNKERQQSCSRIDILSSSEIYNNSIEISTDSYKKYSTWYWQMKGHIKQIEMSLYIEEVSKM